MLYFRIIDQQNGTQAEELERAFCDLGLEPVTSDEPWDILAVHKNTDGRLSATKAAEVLQAGGVYIAYSTGARDWKVVDERSFYGSHDELLVRLRRLSRPVAIEELRKTLEDSLPGSTQAESDAMALAILCQTYLAMFGGSDGRPALSPTHPDYDDCARALERMGWTTLCAIPGVESELAAIMHSLAGKQAEVTSTAWWSAAFDRGQSELTMSGALMAKAGGGAVKELLLSIWSSQNDSASGDVRESLKAVDPGIVARAYIELSNQINSEQL